MEKGAITKHDISKAPKTGEWRYMKPEVSEEKCIGCGTCVKFCPEAVIELEKMREAEKGKAGKIREVIGIDYDFCKGCGVCANVCPVKAIIMKKV